MKKYLFRLGGERIYRQIQYLYWVNNFKKGKTLEPEIKSLPQFIKEGDQVIDIGAHMGLYTLAFSKLVGDDGCIYSFEPVGVTFDILKKIVKKFNLKNVKLFNNALSEIEGVQILEVPYDKSGQELLSRARLARETNEEVFKNSQKYKVKSLTLDYFIKSHNIPRVNFIKCDVEGAELLVFRGAKHLLEKYQPVILCEVASYRTVAFGYQPQDLVDFMANFGYLLYACIDGKLSEVGKPCEGVYNYFFISKKPRGTK